MDVLFSQPWMHEFAQSWNDEKGMTESLATADFSTVIGFGYQDEDTPRGVIEVLHGRVATAGEYSGIKGFRNVYDKLEIKFKDEKEAHTGLH